MNILRPIKKSLSSTAIFSSLFFAVFFVLLLLAPIITAAQGNLLVFPKRLVFDGVKRSLTLNLANTGKDSATYIISFIQIRMKEDGTFENIIEPDSGQNFASKYLRIFPRSITLAPKESQTVKVQLIHASNLAPGEYRSHIYFRAAPPATPAGQKKLPAESTNLTVKLVPVFGISIPAIIQVGENTSMANISNTSVDLTDTLKPQLSIYLNRTGNMSIYGDFVVDHISAQGKKTHVGTLNGIAVYAPLSRRKIKMLLEALPDIDYHSGKLHILYVSSATSKASVLSEQELSLQ